MSWFRKVERGLRKEFRRVEKNLNLRVFTKPSQPLLNLS